MGWKRGEDPSADRKNVPGARSEPHTPPGLEVQRSGRAGAAPIASRSLQGEGSTFFTSHKASCIGWVRSLPCVTLEWWIHPISRASNGHSIALAPGRQLEAPETA